MRFIHEFRRARLRAWLALTAPTLVAFMTFAESSSAAAVLARIQAPVKLKPGDAWKSPDGHKTVVNQGPTYIYITPEFHGMELMRVRVAVPLRANAKVRGLNENDADDTTDDDSITVTGKAELEDCVGTDIGVSKGGEADCTDCDHNDIEFGDGGGKIKGENNDSNKITNSKTNNGDTSDIRGKDNQFKN
jgi:hypothetical protein